MVEQGRAEQPLSKIQLPGAELVMHEVIAVERSFFILLLSMGHQRPWLLAVAKRMQGMDR